MKLYYRHKERMILTDDGTELSFVDAMFAIHEGLVTGHDMALEHLIALGGDMDKYQVEVDAGN